MVVAQPCLPRRMQFPVGTMIRSSPIPEVKIHTPKDDVVRVLEV